MLKRQASHFALENQFGVRYGSTMDDWKQRADAQKIEDRTVEQEQPVLISTEIDMPVTTAISTNCVETTANVRVPAAFLEQLTSEPLADFVTLEIPLEEIQEEVKRKTVELEFRSDSFTAVLDEHGQIRVPTSTMKSCGFSPGQRVRVVITSDS